MMSIEIPYNILAQPVFDRLRSILCCFIYFQVLLFWLLLYIIYQAKRKKYRALKFSVSYCKSDIVTRPFI